MTKKEFKLQIYDDMKDNIEYLSNFKKLSIIGKDFLTDAKRQLMYFKNHLDHDDCEASQNSLKSCLYHIEQTKRCIVQ